VTPHLFEAGFAAPSTDAALAFRAIMTAMARPGRIERMPCVCGPTPLSPAAATVLLTLCDPETRLYLAPGFDTDDLRGWIAFHIGAPLSDPAGADFALGDWHELQPIDRFRRGVPDYPDRSATLIVEAEALDNTGATLSGPGIATTAHLSLPEIAAFQANARQFPLGLDFFFTAGDRVAALPRSTAVS
jgi:alpha-D-ribose 1-methylphosphonate 5-triphosphate synthase subunit PhnH